MTQNGLSAAGRSHPISPGISRASARSQSSPHEAREQPILLTGLDLASTTSHVSGNSAFVVHWRMYQRHLILRNRLAVSTEAAAPCTG